MVGTQWVIGRIWDELGNADWDILILHGALNKTQGKTLASYSKSWGGIKGS